MRRTLFYLVLICLSGCEKKTDWTLQSPEKTYVIVDGTITNEVKAQSIRLSYSVTNLNEQPTMITGASVIISNQDSTWFLTEQPGNPGVYFTKNNFFAKTGREYSLIISVNGNVYSAKSQMKTNKPFTLLRYAKSNNNSGLYNITWVANAYNAVNPAMYEIDLDWSHVSGYTTLNPELCKARMYYYSLPTIDVSEIFAPEMEKIQFPSGTRIVERKYSLNEDYVEFIRAMISETNWKGGYFDSAPANVPTNLSEGALGFFACCNVVSDSLVVN
jgi:hypothetical protein